MSIFCFIHHYSLNSTRLKYLQIHSNLIEKRFYKIRRGQPSIYGAYPNIQPAMHRPIQSIEHASNSPQDFAGKIPFTQ